MLGAHVTVISSSDERLAAGQGSWAPTRASTTAATPEWAKATREITGGRGYDLIVELGGEKTLPQSLRCIRPGGTVAMIGILSGSAMTASLGTRHHAPGAPAGRDRGPPRWLRGDAARDGPAPDAAVIDRVFAFEELKEAMAYLESGAQFGKVCIAH